MAVLDLFPARVRFTDENGLLTPAAYRALHTLLNRVGGGLIGDSGDDFLIAFSSSSDGDGMQGNGAEIMQPADIQQGNAESIYQPSTPEYFAQEISQPANHESFHQEIFQPAEQGALPIQSVTTSSSPYSWIASRPGYLSIQGGTISQIDLIRFGTSITLDLASRVVPVSTGDGITITYTSAPALKFIPR